MLELLRKAEVVGVGCVEVDGRGWKNEGKLEISGMKKTFIIT